MKQGSQEWHKVRLGKITASQMSRVMGSNRSWSSYARQLRDELAILDRINAGEDIELGNNFDNEAMAWGRRWEPVARAEYEFREDCDVNEDGFIIHPEYPFIGASPDGSIEPDDDSMLGTLEIKCPFSESVHLATIANGMPSSHKPQTQTQIWTTGAHWVSFVSYDSRRDLARQYFHQKIERDGTYINLMESRCLEFWEFVQSGTEGPGKIKSDRIRSNTIPELF